MVMNWKYFVGAGILSCGLLLKAGAPILPLAVGVTAAAYCNWQRHRST